MKKTVQDKRAVTIIRRDTEQRPKGPDSLGVTNKLHLTFQPQKTERKTQEGSISREGLIE